eukprot:scaffold142203_cov84-Phaeocystis_antarctica.AAC.2
MLEVSQLRLGRVGPLAGTLVGRVPCGVPAPGAQGKGRGTWRGSDVAGTRTRHAHAMHTK